MANTSGPSYYQPTEAFAILFLGNLNKKIDNHAQACDLIPPRLDDFKADVNRLLWEKSEFYPAVAELAKKVNAYKHLAAKGDSTVELAFPALPEFTDVPPMRPAGMLTRIFNELSRMKLSPGYNDEFIGQDLWIVNPVANSVEHLYPPFALLIELGLTHKIVRIDFKKYKHNSVYIECRINGGPWEFLAIDNAKPHLDDRPLQVAGIPETREYRMRWWDRGEAHGDWSPIQSISVTA